jgi:hypothetical protein
MICLVTIATAKIILSIISDKNQLQIWVFYKSLKLWVLVDFQNENVNSLNKKKQRFKGNNKYLQMYFWASIWFCFLKYDVKCDEIKLESQQAIN